MAEGLLEKGLFCGGTAFAGQGVVDAGDALQRERGRVLMDTQDFFRPGAYIAVVTQDGRQVAGIFSGDCGYGAEKDREADGEDALFAAGEDTSAEVQGSNCGIFRRGFAEIACDHADFFGLLGRGCYGFAELAETEHGNGASIAWSCLGVTGVED
jgi:hypothetical protein